MGKRLQKLEDKAAAVIFGKEEQRKRELEEDLKKLQREQKRGKK